MGSDGKSGGVHAPELQSPPGGRAVTSAPAARTPNSSPPPSRPCTQMSPILTPASDTSYASTPGKRDRGRNVPLADSHRLATRPRLSECTLAQVTPLADQPDVQALRPQWAPERSTPD